MLRTESSRDPNPNPYPNKYVFMICVLNLIVWGALFINAVTHDRSLWAIITLLITAYFGGVVGRVCQTWYNLEYG